MKSTAFMLFEYPYVIHTLRAITTQQAIIEAFPYLLQVQHGHFRGYVGFPVGCDREEAPFFMTKALVKGVKQVGTPIPRVTLGAAWTTPLFAGDPDKGYVSVSKIMR